MVEAKRPRRTHNRQYESEGRVKKAAIMIDDWKLSIFTQLLDETGFKYTQYDGPVKGCMTLKVDTKDVLALHQVVKAANDEAAELKARGE